MEYSLLGGKLSLLTDIKILTVASVIVRKYGYHVQMHHTDIPLPLQITKGGEPPTSCIPYNLNDQ